MPSRLRRLRSFIKPKFKLVLGFWQIATSIEAVYEVYCNRDLSAEELNGLGTIRQTDASARKANLDGERELNNVNEKNLKGTPHPEMNKYFNGTVPRFAPGQ